MPMLPGVLRAASGSFSLLTPQGGGSPTCSFRSTPPGSEPQSPLNSSAGLASTFVMPPTPMAPMTPVLPSSPNAFTLTSAALQEKEYLDVILQCQFFKQLGPAVHRRLSGIVQSVKLPSDTVIFRQGDPPGSCYVILEGAVGIYVKKDEETRPEVDSREGTPRNGPPLRSTWHEGFSPTSDLSESSEDSLSLTWPPRKSESRRNSGRSALNSSQEFASRRSSLKGRRRSEEDDAISRRTSIEWCELPESPEGESRRSSLRRVSTESRMSRSDRQDSKKSIASQEDGGSRRASQQSLRRSSTDRCDRQDSKKSQREGRAGSKSSVARSRTSLVLNIPEDQSSDSTKRRQSDDEREAIHRIPTHEGFSVYHGKSELGAQVVRLVCGQLFGELALMGDQPRAASAKCLEETHFLVISRHDFDALLKSDLGKQKDVTTGFLRRHVPGMSDLAEQSRFGKPHASYYFKEQSVPKGFLFVKQGEKTSERFWVLRKGVVEFWHCDPEVPAKTRPGSSTKRPTYGGRGRRIALLLEGGLFSTLPTNDAEPFTVVAQSLCEVFCVNKGDFNRLPYRVICAVQDHLMQAAMWRLNRCIEGRSCLRPRKEVKESVPVEEPMRKVLAELLHCDNISDEHHKGPESVAQRLLKEGQKKTHELRAPSPTRVSRVASPEPRRPQIRPSSAAAKFYKLQSSYVNIGLRRSDGTVRTVTRVASATQLARRRCDAKAVPRCSAHAKSHA